MSSLSPITGIIKESQVILEFGPYEGKTLSEVETLDPEFYQRLLQDKDHLSVRRHRDKTFRLYINPLFQLDQ